MGDQHGVIVAPTVQWAHDAIAAKAAEAAARLGIATGSVELIQPANTNSGYVQRFESGAVYYTEDTGAHEVNGEIAAKYERLGGPSWSGKGLGTLTPIGYPVTDEQDLSDNGKVSHFQHGSIYWHARTGPMAVHDVLKPGYQAAGFEAGALGFPTRDTHQWQPGNPANSHLSWGLFENGCIATTPNGLPIVCGPGSTATVSADTLKTLVRHIADNKVHEHDINVGLQPDVDIVNVSDWQSGLDESGRRMITYRLYAFKDTGVLLPDVHIRILVKIQFDWKRDDLSLFDGSVQTLVARLPQTPGVDNPGIETATEAGIPVAFGSQDFGVNDSLELGAIPVDSPGVQPPVRAVLDMIVTPAGDLQLFTNPSGLFGTGGDLGPEVQQRLDAKVADLLAS